MAISQKLPPPEPATIETECGSGSSESIPSASISDDQDNAFEISENGAATMTSKSRTRVRVPPKCCKRGRSITRHKGYAACTRPDSIACLRQHLASLRSLLPHSARSSKARNLVADALRYKNMLRKQIETLQKALPYAQQVNVRRLGPSGGLKIDVSCDKEPGLLVALMEAIESFGLAFTNMNVSCLNEKIRLDAVGDMEISERIGSLKVALMATIMRFSQPPISS
ncbi:hypothetical protein GOP47_0021702 [Adiantum capillus-veneris]|uniref:Plant bHLH transcription factor ACT-like domain-containing protein n=1 Tax=Adiantum capillus-veneris TaxID=13818 RepID=A0A9D4U883_ADICA|nr:hypothetical protein GOP47_0021702 [Adiantum capillus-veneris]